MKSWLTKWFKKSTEPAHLTAGRWGEEVAARFLKKKKYKLIGQRVRVGKRDEIDIIAKHAGILIFVEVKTRKNENYGRPITAVNAAKRKHLSRAAIAYFRQEKITPDFIRFDVIEVIGEPTIPHPEIRHIENAFPLDSAYKLWW